MEASEDEGEGEVQKESHYETVLVGEAYMPAYARNRAIASASGSERPQFASSRPASRKTVCASGAFWFKGYSASLSMARLSMN